MTTGQLRMRIADTIDELTSLHARLALTPTADRTPGTADHVGISYGACVVLANALNDRYLSLTGRKPN